MSGKRTLAWSYGGGVQSAAIAVLVRTGALPVPDLAVIADTGRERRTTWTYLREVIQPYLDPTGLTIQIAPHTLASADLFNPNSGLTLMPAWTEDGRLPSYCSGWWKRDVCERWLRLQSVKTCDMWIGYSWDEKHRCTADHRQWCHLDYPLVDRLITREACKILIEKAGLPPAPKSRCWQCPHQTPEEWADVKEDPEEFAAAVAVEKMVNESDPEGSGKLFLYSGRVPLEMADFEKDKPIVPPIFRACEGGGCWT